MSSMKPLTDVQKSILRDLLDEHIKHGFECSYPLEPIAKKHGLTVKELYDNNTNTGLLWDLGSHGEGLLHVGPPDFNSAYIEYDMHQMLANWSRADLPVVAATPEVDEPKPAAGPQVTEAEAFPPGLRNLSEDELEHIGVEVAHEIRCDGLAKSRWNSICAGSLLVMLRKERANRHQSATAAVEAAVAEVYVKLAEAIDKHYASHQELQAARAQLAAKTAEVGAAEGLITTLEAEVETLRVALNGLFDDRVYSLRVKTSPLIVSEEALEAARAALAQTKGTAPAKETQP